MELTNRFERRTRPDYRRPRLSTLAIITSLMVNAASAVLLAAPPDSAPGLAFARYIASIEKPSPFNEPGTAAMEITAALPGLYKQFRLLAIRKIIDSEHSEYGLAAVEGDVLAAEELVVPYLEERDQIERLPLSSVSITPANYRFRYVGVAGNGPVSAYVFRIVPKKKRYGLVDGQLWIDAASGEGILLMGQLAKAPPGFSSRPRFVRTIEYFAGVPAIRITHVRIQTKHAGTGELTIAESRSFRAEVTPRSSLESFGKNQMR